MKKLLKRIGMIAVVTVVMTTLIYSSVVLTTATNRITFNNNKLSMFLSYFERTEVVNIDEIKEANVVIYNKTMGAGGSGTSITYEGKQYILSCAHLIGKATDKIVAVDNNKKVYELALVKQNKALDLSLFIISKNDLTTLQLAEENPKEGSKTVVIGNPAMIEDVVTNGVVAKVKWLFSYYTNVIYCGNSGGAVLHKREVVGVATQIKAFAVGRIEVCYSYGPNLNAIKTFLIGV